ncbi:MAG TPA: hypothetical protein VFA03_04890 [Acetobacteraceae bacterium]|nr:hypothetical protein [Acetobacteraceae bacterium]
MAVTISVPGANHTTVFRTYTDAGNSALAQSIAATIATLTNLTVSSVTGGGQVAIPITSPQGLEFSGTGSYTVPSGYAYAVDNVSPAALAVSMGGGVFIGGDGNIGFTNAPGASDTVLAGNGNDTFALSGRYQVAAGTGADTYSLGGTGVVSLGGGVNAVTITTGADTVFASSGNKGLAINGAGGALFYYGSNTPGVVVDTIAGGTGGSTVVGGNNEAIAFIGNAAASIPGLLVAGGGNETLVAANSPGRDLIFGSAVSGTSDVLLASNLNSSSLVGGAGSDSLVGGAAPTTFFINNGLKGNDFIYNANGADTLALTGFDSLPAYSSVPGGAATVVKAALATSNTVTLADGTKITFAGAGANGISIFSS